MNKLDALYLRLRSLAVFRDLLDSGILRCVLDLLCAADKPLPVQAARYARFAADIFENGGNLTDCIWALTLQSDNVYARRRAKGQSIDRNLKECVSAELETLAQISRLTPDDLRPDTGTFLPAWESHTIDFSQAYAAHMENVSTRGFGMFASSHMFTVRDGAILPVKTPDPVWLDDLKGYARQKKAVEDNTRALLSGKPAANVLLYGDAGTGKSSTVKALANAYHTQGLRLIELPKKQFSAIPALAESLADHPLKFILFIDDLSFFEADADFNALKAVLEGSVCAKAPNTVVYATSNRRHMVKELFSSREGDDIHRNETIQELCALSHRFGLQVGFFKPDKQAYLDIVRALMADFGMEMDQDNLEREAERFASQGRSPRLARQFVDNLRRSKYV